MATWKEILITKVDDLTFSFPNYLEFLCFNTLCERFINSVVQIARGYGEFSTNNVSFPMLNGVLLNDKDIAKEMFYTIIEVHESGIWL